MTSPKTVFARQCSAVHYQQLFFHSQLSLKLFYGRKWLLVGPLIYPLAMERIIRNQRMGVGHFNQICWAKSLPCLPLSITRASFKGRVAFVCPWRANDYAPADDRHHPREMMTSDPDVTFISKGTALQLLEGHHFSILKLDPAAFRLVCASLSARLSVCLPLSFWISVCLSVSLFDSLFLYFLSLSAGLSVSLCLCLYLSVSVCLSVCLSVALSLPPCLSLSRC